MEIDNILGKIDKNIRKTLKYFNCYHIKSLPII